MTEKELAVVIGQRIKKIRLEKGLSQNALAVLIDSEKSNVSRLESGRINAGVYTLFKVAHAFGMELDEFLKLD